MPHYSSLCGALNFPPSLQTFPFAFACFLPSFAPRNKKKNGHLETRCNKARHRIDAAAYVRTYLSAPFFHPFIYLIRSSTKSPVVWLCVCVCVRAQTTTCLHRPWWGSFVMSSDVSVVSATFSTHQPTETFRGDRQKMMGENLEEKEKNWEEEEEE